MEVHHHAHTARKKWTHYFWEFFMLFLAVFCGFLAENQREHHIEHKRAKAYARILKADLIYDTISLNNYLIAKDTEMKKMSDAMRVREKDEEEITMGDLRFLDSTHFLISPFKPHNATLTQLKSSGSLRYFESLDLKSRLANYEWTIENLDGVYASFAAMGGGIHSEHILQYEIHLGKFLNKREGIPNSVLAAKAGYNFKSWNEYNVIVGSLMQAMQLLYENGYPSLKEFATEIIQLLNKEYHLH